MANNKLQMPADYVALNESEMSCVEGGGVVSQVSMRLERCSAVSTMIIRKVS